MSKPIDVAAAGFLDPESKATIHSFKRKGRPPGSVRRPAAPTLTPSPAAPNVLAIVLPFVGTENAEQSVTDAVRNAAREADPFVLGEKEIADELGNQIEHQRLVRTRERQAQMDTPLTSVAMPDARDHGPPQFETYLFAGMIVSVLFGMAVACNSLAAVISDSDVLASLTGHYSRALFMSGIGITGAILFKAGSSLCHNEEEERHYYKRLLRFAIASSLIYVAIISLAFAPHHIDLSAVQEAFAGGGTIKSPFQEAMKSLAEYTLAGAQLVTEMTMAPVIFYAVTRKHMAGRPVYLAEHNAQIHHRNRVAVLDAVILDLVKERSPYTARFDRNVRREATLIADALRLLRKLEAERVRAMQQAADTFVSKQATGA